MNKLHQGAVVAVVLVLGVAAVSWACSTPVYRYALYRWQRAPYEVFYLHQGEPSEQDAAVNKALAAMSSDGPGEGKTANLRFTSIDVSDEKVLASLPPELQETLKQNQDKPLPWHVVYTPRWTQLYVGRLDEKSTKTLIDSPARQKMNKLLSGGAPCVLVLVPGKDKAINRLAREHIATTIKNAGDGKFTPPEDPFDGTFGDPDGANPDGAGPNDALQDDAREQPKLPSVATISVQRDDPREQWLIRCLMQAEGDLQPYVEEAMVFAVYGRSRVMPPCIGKGITPENLGDYVVFSMGPCSCEVKDQNPGMDLLSQWDWQQSASALAELFGNETGNEALLQTDEFLQLLVTPPSDLPAVKDEQPAKQDVEPKDGASQAEPTAPTTNTTNTTNTATGKSFVTAIANAESQGDQRGDADQSRSEKQYAATSDDKALVRDSSTTEPVSGQIDDDEVLAPRLRMLRNLAIATTLTLTTLLVVGFLFLRPRGG